MFEHSADQLSAICVFAGGHGSEKLAQTDDQECGESNNS